MYAKNLSFSQSVSSISKMKAKFMLVILARSLVVQALLRRPPLVKNFGALFKMLKGRVWSPSLHQEIPCSIDGIQMADLAPNHSWRIFSPRYPSSTGYPHNAACTWKFRIRNPSKIQSVSIICDHLDIVGNYFNDCLDGDYLLVRLEDDDDDPEAPGKLCGDLKSWIPLNGTIKIHNNNLEQRFAQFFFLPLNGASCCVVFQCVGEIPEQFPRHSHRIFVPDFA